MPFPSSLPSYAAPTSGETLAAGNHASLHGQEETDITATATKMGTGASTPVNNTVLRGNGTGTSTWDTVHLANDVQGLLSTSNLDTIAMLKLVYPVGCIYTETTGTNPSTTFGFGAWTQTGQGRVLVGQGTSDQLFTASNTGGESNHTLVSNELPSHNHTLTDPGHAHGVIASNGGLGTTALQRDANDGFGNIQTVSNTTSITLANTGGGATHNNLQPYQVVYYWQRAT